MPNNPQIQIIDGGTFTVIGVNGVMTSYPKNTLCFQAIPTSDKVVIKSSNSLSPIISTAASNFVSPTSDAFSVVTQCMSHYAVEDGSGGGGGGSPPNAFKNVIIPKHTFGNIDTSTGIIDLYASVYAVSDSIAAIATVVDTAISTLNSAPTDTHLQIQLTQDQYTQVVTNFWDTDGNRFSIASMVRWFSDGSFFHSTIDVVPFLLNPADINAVFSLTSTPPAGGIGYPNTMSIWSPLDSALYEVSPQGNMASWSGISIPAGMSRLNFSCRDGLSGMTTGDVFTEVKIYL